jgi:HD superfamily phosphohydrolase YqeK
LAAAWLKGESAFNNESILAAVRYHTTLAPDMDIDGLTVFVADKIDPIKIKQWPELAEVRRVAYSGELRMAVEIYLRLRLTSLTSDNRTIHPRSVNALNWLIGLRQWPA